MSDVVFSACYASYESINAVLKDLLRQKVMGLNNKVTLNSNSVFYKNEILSEMQGCHHNYSSNDIIFSESALHLQLSIKKTNVLTMNASFFISRATLSCLHHAPTYRLVCSVLISMTNRTYTARTPQCADWEATACTCLLCNLLLGQQIYRPLALLGCMVGIYNTRSLRVTYGSTVESKMNPWRISD